MSRICPHDNLLCGEFVHLKIMWTNFSRWQIFFHGYHPWYPWQISGMHQCHRPITETLYTSVPLLLALIIFIDGIIMSILLLTFLSLSKKIFMEYVGKYKSCKKFGLSGSGAGEWYIRCNDPSEPGNWTARRIGPHLHWQHRITLTHCRVSTLLLLQYDSLKYTFFQVRFSCIFLYSLMYSYTPALTLYSTAPLLQTAEFQHYVLFSPPIRVVNLNCWNLIGWEH